MIRQLPWLAFLLAALIFWAPLPFGSVTPDTAALLQGASFVVLALALAFSPAEREALRSVVAPCAALAAIGLLGCAQSLAWPAALVSHLSPAHADLAGRATALLSGGEAAPKSIRLTLSLDASRGAALAWLSLAATLLLAGLVGRERNQRRWLGGALLVAALFEILYGLRHGLAGSPEIWGQSVHWPTGRLRGTFVNPNHLALYLELALAVAVAWTWWAVRRARAAPRFERRLALASPPALVAIILVAGIAASGSRAGLAVALLATALQGFLLARRRGRMVAAGVAIALAVGALAGAVALGGTGGLDRLLATSTYDLAWDGRLAAARATFELWQRFPFLGSGLGSFAAAFPSVQPTAVAGFWRHAHNDWLELAATAGAVGLVIFLIGLWKMIAALASLARRGRRSEDRAAGIAAVGALTAAGLHSLVDFGLTMPATAFTLAVLCGAAVAAREVSPAANQSQLPATTRPG